MTHEEIREKMSGMLRKMFDRQLAELQEMKSAVGDWKPGDPDGEYPDGIDHAIMNEYFDGKSTNEEDERIDAAIGVCKRFTLELIDVGYKKVEKMLANPIRF